VKDGNWLAESRYLQDAEIREPEMTLWRQRPCLNPAEQNEKGRSECIVLLYDVVQLSLNLDRSSIMRCCLDERFSNSSRDKMYLKIEHFRT
jgi:hypothetical protein